MSNTRTEKDSLGTKEVPQKAYWGIQTQRAIENFPISGLRAHPKFIDSFVMVKKAVKEACIFAAHRHTQIGQTILLSSKSMCLIRLCSGMSLCVMLYNHVRHAGVRFPARVGVTRFVVVFFRVLVKKYLT